MLESPHRTREPAINMPGLVVVAIAALLAIHGLRALLSEQADFEFLLDWAFIPGRWSAGIGFADAAEIVREAARDTAEPQLAQARAALAAYVTQAGQSRLWTLATYALLHGSWAHVGLNVVWLAAFATPVVRRLGTGASLILAFATALGGSLAYWLVSPLSTQILIGASGIVSGLMGAAALFVFGPGQSRQSTGRADLAGLVRNRNALVFLGLWLVLNVAVGLLATPLGLVDGGIAWQAHIGGIVVGLLLFPVLDRRRAGPRLAS